MLCRYLIVSLKVSENLIEFFKANQMLLERVVSLISVKHKIYGKGLQKVIFVKYNSSILNQLELSFVD